MSLLNTALAPFFPQRRVCILGWTFRLFDMKERDDEKVPSPLPIANDGVQIVDQVALVPPPLPNGDGFIPRGTLTEEQSMLLDCLGHFLGEQPPGGKPEKALHHLNEDGAPAIVGSTAQQGSRRTSRTATNLLINYAPAVGGALEGDRGLPPSPQRGQEPAEKLEASILTKRHQHFGDDDAMFGQVHKRPRRGYYKNPPVPRDEVEEDLSKHDHGRQEKKQDSSDPSQEELRITASQTGQWYQRYNELVQYKQEHGHCLISYDYKENMPLALWVKRQRHQYKLAQEGLHSTMTDDRKGALEDLGFVWDSQRASWEERLNELLLFREDRGHCNVPTKFHANPRLATWVKCQRRQYKLYCAGKRSNITAERIEKLDEIGFLWNPRQKKSG